MIIYLVRHADSVAPKGLNDREKTLAGLSYFGQLQARALGEGLKNLNIKFIYSSPIIRAVETTEIVSDQIGVNLELDNRLREFFLDFETRDGLRQKSLKEESRLNPNKLMPSGESLNSSIDRLEEAIRDLAKNKNGNVCIVTHRVVTEGLLSRLFNIRKGESDWMESASVTALEVSGDREFNILFYNKRFKNSRLIWETLRRKLGFYR
ncbi:MAG: histidine phosphatase family protein [Crocinitomicaceae bacterium]